MSTQQSKFGRRCGEEFKREVAVLAARADHTDEQVACDLGVSPRSVSRCDPAPGGFLELLGQLLRFLAVARSCSSSGGSGRTKSRPPPGMPASPPPSGGREGR